jgi:ribosomal protein S2
MMHRALQAVSDTVAKGGRILFVGTKRQRKTPSPKRRRNQRNIKSIRAGSAAR